MKKVAIPVLLALSLAAVVVDAPGSAPSKLGQIAAANLSGTVLDEAGAAIAAVDISVINVSTGVERHATSDDRGYFSIPLLGPGTYILSARMTGFATVTIDDVELHASINTALNIVLKPRGFAESLDVVAGRDSACGDAASSVVKIDLSSPATAHSVTNEELMRLPVISGELGRNALTSLPFLAPGVSPTTSLGGLSGTLSSASNWGLSGFSPLVGLGTGAVNLSAFVVSGSRGSSVSFNIEGGGANDDEFNQPLPFLLNPDALEEFTLITSNYEADLGRSAGGIINAVIKSGTPQLKGNVRYLAINDALNARGFFDLRTPRFRLNNFGGQLGGPAAMPNGNGTSRLLFFADYEGTRSYRESTSILEVPSLDERSGNFSTLQPASWPVDPMTGKPFPGGRVPASRFDFIASSYLKLFVPDPNSGAHGFVHALPTRFANDQGTLRLDQTLSARDNLSLVFLVGASSVRAGSKDLPVGSEVPTDARSYDLTFHHTRAFSSASVNQLTGTIIRYSFADSIFSPGASGRDPSELGFRGIHPQSNALVGVPSLQIDGTDVTIYTGVGDSSTKTTVGVRDDFSRNSGRHSARFGAELHLYRESSTWVGSNNGVFSFVGFRDLGTGNAFADFLLGLPNAYFQETGFSAYPRQKSLQFYGMDDFHISPAFTVSVGLRYELTPPAVDKFDHMSAFRPGQRSSVFPAAPPGLIFVGDVDPALGHLPRDLYRTDYGDLAPRIGLSYMAHHPPKWMGVLLGEGKTAVKTGWGVFYDHTPVATSTRISATEPFSSFQILSPFYVPGGSFAAPFGRGPDPWPLDLNKRQFSSFPSVTSIDPFFRTAYTYHYDFLVQRQLTPSTVLDVSYAGTNSFRTIRDRELNPAVVKPGATPDIFNIEFRRTFQSLGSIISAESSGRARSDSLRIQIKRSFSRGLMFDASYTLSKSLDNGGTVFSSAANTDSFQWARSPFDRRHNLVVDFSYDLPGPNLPLIGGMLSGWQMSGIVELRSGLPLDIYQFQDSTLTGGDPSGHGVPDLVGPFARIDPRKALSIMTNGAYETGHFFFDPSAFRVVSITDYTQARAGNLPRNAFDGPGFHTWSVSLGKTCRITDSQRVMVRADIRNLFNHANFGSPVLQADSPFFGQVLSAAPGRTIQLSARYAW